MVKGRQVWQVLWRPASVYSHNRARLHHLIFYFRALLWFLAALFAWKHTGDGPIWIAFASLLMIGALLWRRTNVLEVLNQIFIIVDLILIAIAIHISGGLSSQVYLMYGGEALFLTAYVTLRYSIAGAIAMALSYGIATGGWDARVFWWRVVIFGIFIVAAGGLGREYQQTRAQSRENTMKLQQISQIRTLQDSILKEQDIDVVLSRLLEETLSLTHADAAYLCRVDTASRVIGFSIKGLSFPADLEITTYSVPTELQFITTLDTDDWRYTIHRLFREAGMKALALIPLRYEGSLYGWMGLASTYGAVSLKAQEFIIQNLADVMSTQLRFQETQSVAAKRGQLLGILEYVGRIVNRNLEMEQLLRSLRQAVSDVLETDGFFVAFTLPDDPGHVLMQYLWDDGEEYPPEILPLDPAGLTGSVVTTGKPLITNGMDAQGTFTGMLTGSQKSPRGMLFVPLIHEGRVLGAISVQSYRIEYDPDHLEFLSAIASQASIAIRNAQMYQQTQEIALTDHLTGLGNARRFNIVGQSAIEMAEESGQPLSLLLIDSDSLKSINDRFGHRAGDLHIQRVAQAIRENIRENDMAFRYAGDEFVIILPKSQLAEAAQVGERIRHEMETNRFHWSDTLVLGSTISVGAAEFESGMDAEALFQLADRAMYLAKQQGKNRVAQAQ